MFYIIKYVNCLHVYMYVIEKQDRIIVPIYVSNIQSLGSSVTNAVAILNTPDATNELHSITVTCTIHPDSTAD